MTEPILLLLSGQNLNLLGEREPSIYGTATLDDHVATATEAAAARGHSIEHVQSNHEGVLIDAIHEAGRAFQDGAVAGVVFNAGAYTHTSIALHDAVRSVAVPVVEVHISNVHAREAFRHHSYLSPVARAVMCGFGVAGYGLAIDGLAAMATA